MYKKTLKFCRQNPQIIFTKSDKGNTTVAIDRDAYINKVEDLLNDKQNYMIVKQNPSLKIEKELNKNLKHWLNKEWITKKEYYFLSSSDSILPKAYGLPKLHKDNIPFRIIVSSINTALYHLASYLHDILSKSLPRAKGFVNNSFDLCSALSNFVLNEDEIVISLDVISLFTNVPLDLAIDSINNRWSHIENHTKIDKNDFINAIKFVLNSTFFTFNNIIYKQIFGTPMGSPLSPIIADIVMQDLETSIFNSLNVVVPFYYRYVDDILLCIREDQAILINDKFNDYHNRLKFTMEREENRCINFLDLTIKIINNIIHIDWFQKSTFSGRTLSFFSNHPMCHKRSIIYNLVDRSILLSHPTFHSKNLTLIINILLNNGYPLHLIFTEINRRIKFLITNKLNTNETYNNGTSDSNNDNKIVVIPYIERISKLVASELKKENITVGYRCLKRLNGIIKAQKDKDSLLNNSGVVYKISCNNCDATYIGQTKRQLGTRLKEHRNNIKLDSARHSVISDHTVKLTHTFNWDNTKILDHENNYHKRLISEMIHIKEEKNSINLKKDIESLDGAYFDVLEKLSMSS